MVHYHMAALPIAHFSQEARDDKIKGMLQKISGCGELGTAAGVVENEITVQNHLGRRQTSFGIEQGISTRATTHSV